jgi:hypothetical protein
MPTRKVHRYTGVLGAQIYTPLEAEADRRPNDLELRERSDQEIGDQYRARVEALLKDCGTGPDDPSRWWHVALTLADRHVKGFRFRSKRGRKPKKASAPDLLNLVAEMDRLCAKGEGISSAAGILKNKLRLSNDQIEGRYRRFKRRLENLRS